jgi:hypothetical protein
MQCSGAAPTSWSWRSVAGHPLRLKRVPSEGSASPRARVRITALARGLSVPNTPLARCVRRLRVYQDWLRQRGGAMVAGQTNRLATVTARDAGRESIARVPRGRAVGKRHFVREVYLYDPLATSVRYPSDCLSRRQRKSTWCFRTCRRTGLGAVIVVHDEARRQEASLLPSSA